jgi:2-polyprenyl-3-methyl-5-hydroxy-6-metoxy-1,4-benzoquinol methylase
VITNQLTAKYVHTKELHNDQSPKEIVPLLMSFFSPQSVIDIGCGTGTFLKEFKKNGVKNVIGYDGTWVNQSLLNENLDESEFTTCNLEEPLSFDKKFDLAVCLEVAEHLAEKSADMLISNLTEASDVIVFSAAIPGQGGQNHVNEQWLEYWQVKFEAKGYVIDDVIKPLIWNNDNIDYWYKQNMVVARKSGYTYNRPQLENTLVNPINQELFTKRTLKYNYLKGGNERPKLYLKLFLQSIFKGNKG